MRNALSAVAWVAVCFAVAAAGQLLFGVGPGDWYRQLHKPSFNPPNWIFGPVWTLLYFMMGISAWLIWCRRASRHVALPLSVFAIQLLLNALWTPLFFGLKNPGAAFAEIIFLWAAILLTVITFMKVSRFAGWLMVPYLCWVTFAAVLNGCIWRMNS